MATDQLTAPVEKLRNALAEPSVGREGAWAAALCASLTELSLALQTHILDMDGRAGLASTVDLTRPSLVREVADVRREHADFLKQVQEFVNQVQRTAEVFDPASSDAVAPPRLPAPTPATGPMELGTLREEVERFLAALEEHQNHESGLVLESVTTDLGAGD
jgi:hypothetical protein